MTWHELGNPRPRTEPQEYVPLVWPEGDTIRFEPVISDREGSAGGATRSGGVRDFQSLASSRRTRYEFGAPSLAALGALFGMSARVLAHVGSPLGFPLSMRPAPSAGGIHPIHIVLNLDGSGHLYRYDPFEHGLRPLSTTVNVPELRRAMDQVIDGQDGALLMFVAEPGRTFAKYLDASSLVWRDAGVLLGYCSMAAEALDLNLVPLGVTGEPWAGRLLDQEGLVGVGAALVGARP